MLDTFSDDLNVAVIGASGGIGDAFVKILCAQENVKTIYSFSRSDTSFQSEKVQAFPVDICDELSIQEAVKNISKKLDVIIVATGALHDAEGLSPEKSLRDINQNNFEKIFAVNTIGPALLMKHFLPLLHRDKKSVFAALSARVGSISDNALGGWYAYRASKSALNMLIKNASIEVARRNNNAVIIGLHPGTVETSLSEPFQGNVEDGKLFTPAFSARSLLSVINNATVDKTGKVFDWDNKEILP